MCGIIGYIGPNDAVPYLLEGLKRMEYRGYDSAGVAVFDKQLGHEVIIPHSTGNAMADAIAAKHGINLIEEHWLR